MTVVYAYEGKEVALEAIQAAYSVGVLTLFQNDIDPDNDSVYADFEFADFSGFAPVQPPTWGVTVPNVDGNAQQTALVCSFAHNGGGTANDIYGWAYLYYNGGTPYLAFAERFDDAPRVMSGIGDVINITPAMTQGSCPP